ncbi:ATP-binding protein [Azospirillum thermophilum]|uniref:histidine kinase n=1 Tax=Azospirillum thermophilum TaxID=2202148 RepID=A0A2S2CTW7_9PROT|nr:ATP-binding protein [Azospirillum thermophilum]AWK87855.1 PAS domain-containing sensor histidine kinase [Azospirillum thermophilum]
MPTREFLSIREVLKGLPPARFLVAFALLLAPLAVALGMLVGRGVVSLPAALFGALVAAAGMALLVRASREEAARIADCVTQLAETGSAALPPGRLTVTARSQVLAALRLYRTMARRVERVQAQIDANDSILDALHDPLVLVDGERQVTRANLAARGLFGERVVGRDLAASLRNPKVLEAVDAVLRGAASRVVEFTLPVPVERMFEVQVKPFRRRLDPVPGGAEEPGGTGLPAALPGETVRMAILTLHDVTAARRSEQMRADFIANASHELRTPLSSLLGFIETLRGPARDDPEAQERFLSIMHDQASRMTRLVNDLLSLSRIELDEHMPPADRVDVLEQVDHVVAALELKAAARDIRLRLEAPDELPPVAGDADQLTQVFQNLVSNAIKYAREGTEVTISVTLADGAVVGFPGGSRRGGRGQPLVAVAVRDRGEGIARTHLPRLTERFYRVDAARSRAMGGTGLGLAIVKHILNRHRGRLTIESEVGVGSTFTVYLPAAEEQAEASARRKTG